MSTMDEAAANEALGSANITASKMKKQDGSLNSAGVFLLGVAESLLVLVFGLFSGGSAGTLGIILALIPLFALTIYTATRPVVLRHRRNLHAVLAGIAAAIITVTMVIGRAFFVDSLPWWAAGAVLSAVPFFLVGWIEIVARRTDRVSSEKR